MKGIKITIESAALKSPITIERQTCASHNTRIVFSDGRTLDTYTSSPADALRRALADAAGDNACGV